MATVLFALVLPYCAMAQSDEGVSLGEMARAARSKKMAVAVVPVIDNDNLSDVMEQKDLRRPSTALEFGIEPSGKTFQVISPDATCSLSFNANAAPLLTVPVAPQELPADDLAKLDGPATISDDTLQISVHNGSDWNLREITVGLTIVRADTDNYENLAKLLPSPPEPTVVTEKHSDRTLLLHLKGTAAPASTALFSAKLTNLLTPDQDWHWAIVQAKGIPSSPAPLLADSPGANETRRFRPIASELVHLLPCHLACCGTRHQVPTGSSSLPCREREILLCHQPR